MKFKSYFNNLEKYWSANFLALISSVFFLFVITWVGINLASFMFKAVNFSELWKLICNSFPYCFFYPIIFFPVSCYLAAYISIFYIFIIISQKKWFVFASALIILIVWSSFFAGNQELQNLKQASGFFILFYYIPMTIISVLISGGIYLILLLLELIPKFRVPKSIVSQNNIFKKYIRVFYWLYFILICGIIYILIYVLTYSSIPRY